MKYQKSIEFWNNIELDTASEKRMLDRILTDAHQLNSSNLKESIMNTKNVNRFRPRRFAVIAAVVIMALALSTAALAATGVLERLFAVPAPIMQPDEIPTPRPQDISEETAVGKALAEIERVFNADVSSYTTDAKYEFSVSANGLDDAKWVITIDNESCDYFCVLDAVTGQISLLHFSDLTKAGEDLDSRYSPLPGDNSYNEAAVEAMSFIDNETPIIGARFFRDGFNTTQIVYWIAVSLDDGNDYLIGITKNDKTFVGYSYNEGRINEVLLNQ